MEDRVNTKKKILKSFSGWVLSALASAFFYGPIFVLIVMWQLTNYTGVIEEQARHIDWVVGQAFLLFWIYAYLNCLTKSLYSYMLSIENGNPLARGKTGWKSLYLKIPINTMQKRHIGQNATRHENMPFDQGAIQDQVSSWLTFFSIARKSFKSDFSANALDNEFLYAFLVFLKSKSIETNVNA